VESERTAPRGKRQKDATKSGRPAAKAGRKLSNAKREERERRQRIVRVRRFALALAAAVAVGVAVWGLVALYRAPILPVKNIEVSGGTHHDRTSILEIADIPDDATLLRLPARRIAARLQADPWINSAEVSRGLPGTVRISVTERIPAALVDAGGTNVLIVSKDGYWLGKRTAEDADLIIVSGVESVSAKPGAKVQDSEVLNALAVIDRLSPGIREMTASISAPSVDETAIITSDDVEIFVGEAVSMDEKNRIVEEILGTHKGVVYVNVRVVERPTWRGLSDD
jgi:cell division protein FtsQ